MISSKRIDLIAILLIIIIVFLMILSMIYYDNKSKSHKVGSVKYSDLHSVYFTQDDYYSNYSENGVTKINLNGSTASSESNNVAIDGGNITILGGGTYVLSGELDNGCIIVDSENDAQVRFILNNASVISEDFSALYVKQAEKTVISTVRGTVNTFTDGRIYSESKLEKNKSTAAVYSKDNLTINGNGTLIINGNYQDGIKSNDALKITEGSVRITAADEGINSNDYFAAVDADITINAGGDAVKSKHEDTEKGFIALENTDINIISAIDGINASSSLYLIGGNYKISVEDDAVHAEQNAVIQPENLDITECYEGIEGAFVEINGGSINITSADDGINAVGLNSNGGFGMPVMGMRNKDITDEDIYLKINDGNIVINAGGDGIDSNGAALINGGNIYIYGPENNANSSLDSEYGFIINGGSILAAGSAGMAESPRESSKQVSLMFYLEEAYSGKNTISLCDSSGNEVIICDTNMRFDCVCVSDERISIGEKYTLIINDESVAELDADGIVNIYGSKRFGGRSNR